MPTNTDPSALNLYLKPMSGPKTVFSEERDDIEGDYPGFINLLVHYVFAIHTLLSFHHIAQSISGQYRYLVTDIYFSAWALFALIVGLCDLGLVSRCATVVFPGLVIWLVVYRLIEILPREIWVIFYRDEGLTSTSRVAAVAVLNYATITGLFGYLYGTGGFRKAIEISLTFSASVEMSGLEILQAAYCFVFSVIILATFIGRVQPK